MKTLLKDLSQKININLLEDEIKKFFDYKEILIETNKSLNLTAITEDKEVIIKHFIDSLTINKYITPGAKLIDVGTGAGFPGIPVKIIRSDIDVVLLDSLNKRLNFLNNVIDKLNLKDIKTLHGRAEEVGQNKDFREYFDISTARAVANLSTLSELCLPFVKVGGIFICMKGNDISEVEEAKKAIEILGGKIEQIENFKLPDSDIERNIIIIKKIKPTPNKYPRKPGTPAKEPIK